MKTLSAGMAAVCSILFVMPASWLTAAAMPVPAFAQTADPSCAQASGRAAVRYALVSVNARRGCIVRELTPGGSGLAEDCLGADVDTRMARRLERTAAAIRTRLDSICSSRDLGALGLPGECQDLSPAGIDGAEYARCLVRAGDAAAVAMLAAATPAATGFLRGLERRCVLGVLKRTARAAGLGLKARLRCAADSASGRISGAVDCSADPVPLGAGTGDAMTDSGLLAADLAIQSGIAGICPLLSLTELDFEPECVDGSGATFDVLDVEQCLLDAARPAVSSVLAAAFPASIP
jgi:hypothetical protein